MKRISIFSLAMLLVLAIGLSSCASKAAPSGSSGLAAAGGAKAGGEGGGAEGGGAEAPRGPSLTNPGNLPPAPESGNDGQSQIGEERMIKVEDPAGRFSILFVDTWTQEVDSLTGALRSALKDWDAEVEIVPSQGQTPLAAAQGVDSSQAEGKSGYELLATNEGDVHGLPAASVIYMYEAGKNPVTGKPLRFIASEVFIGSGPTDLLGHVTFSAPFAPYGDVSEIFDNILAGFNWLQGS